ncbi:RNA polymerase sigma factor [Ornithinibacillus sp. 179-J 7C1 HS]|uniref:RNA polymerase sigma factor n=1 Tax=Ornithinibacillus sp. 179-J 7C1 HS TaxID=3142384 RepID=UPI0039A1BFFF
MQLVERLIDKQESALLELMNTYGDYLVRTAFLLLKDHQTAEEAVQDTFVIAFEKIRQLEDPMKLKSWLTAIVTNCCRSRMRKWSWKNILLAIENNHIHDDEATPSAEEELMEWIWNSSLSEAIHELDYKYREVLTLYYFNEMKISEIAELTQEKENTIKSRLKRARIKLKDILVKGEEFLDESERAIKSQPR